MQTDPEMGQMRRSAGQRVCRANSQAIAEFNYAFYGRRGAGQLTAGRDDKATVFMFPLEMPHRPDFNLINLRWDQCVPEVGRKT